MPDVIEGGRPRRGRARREWLLGGVLAAAAVAAAVVVLTGGDDEGNGMPAPSTRPLAVSSADCAASDATAVLREFVAAWNSRDADRLAALLAFDAELDMSTERQRALPPARGGGYTSTQGSRAVLRFVRDRWGVGERLSYERAAAFPGGVVAEGMLATFGDGRRQHMVEARFALDCPRRSVTHAVIGSGETAR